ncbi:hypothetical protein ARMSODRAFT_992371 [Armillaria solidipes]|uniref:Peroxisomal membrane protein PEX14 n=1 Tax=Armillaria solidipes TaxID=1076256 RepID=A0A2H3C2H6_9AGAR|nr:hypothetical protein ARMSODRAFT_992371 [Armillaria solidipes]
MSTPDRQELLRNAVVFLSDPKSQASPLAQRIQFLESKGLNSQEIDIALRQSSNTSAPVSYPAPYSVSPFPTAPSTQWDWRDYFITAVVSGTITYGAVTLFKKYLLPHLQPPSTTAYEQDRDALNAQFDAAEALLKEIQAETALVRAAVEEQKEKVDKTTKDIELVVTEMRGSELKTRDEMREIRDEVNTIREMLPKMIDRNKEAQAQSLAELQQELKSLKALLLSRGSMSISSSPSTPLPTPGRPSIPAWQLAAAPSPMGSTTEPSTPSYTLPTAVSNGKGKEVDIQLAESALSNLRKSFAPPRSASPGTSSRSPTSGVARDPLQKSSLEERLRATFTIGDVSNGPTPDVSARASPAPRAPTIEHPLSPSSTPLPDSPSLPPVLEESPLDRPESPEVAPQPLIPPLTPTESESPKPESPAKDDSDIMAEEHIPEEPVPQDPLPAEPTAKSIPDPAAEPSVEGEPVAEESIAGGPIVEEPFASGEDVDVDALQERLKLVEQRFADVSTSFKRLQAEKLAADAVLRELTPLESLQESDALRDYLQNMSAKAKMSQEEIMRLDVKLETQDERIEEMRDTHRLESKSQSELIDSLRSQLNESEALLKASQSSLSQNGDDISKHKAELERMQAEVLKIREVAKDEEEKRTKAISLLKTVRQKLVKSEKDKEEALRQASALREQEKEYKERDATEKSRLRKDVDTANAEREKAVTGLKAQFDKEIAALKDRYEKELASQKGQFELDAVTTKSSHTKELSMKNSHITQLQSSLGSLTEDKNSLFDELQLRQAELESSQSLLESIQGQNTELQYQLRELEDRVSFLNEELLDAQRGRADLPREPGVSSEEVARLLVASEAKYEAKVMELQRGIAIIEKERNDTEAEWSRKLREKVKETEELKRALGATVKSKEQDEGVVNQLHQEISELRKELETQRRQVDELRSQLNQAQVAENDARSHQSEYTARITTLEQNVDEGKSREAQLRVSNKTLREELRKVQSSAALLERQRNPGVGYWTTRGESVQSDAQSPPPSQSPSPASSPRPDSAMSNKNDEEVNLEYLRNVVLQFLEHKEMRPNLVKVLSIILRFTPQETRRLMAKV